MLVTHRRVQIRYQYRSSELTAYIVGTLLTVIVILVWPALMLLAGVFTCSTFNAWTILVVVLCIVTAFLIGVLPVITEIVQVRRHVLVAPFPQIDIIGAVTIVWRARGKIYQVCFVQYCVQQLYTVNCTHTSTD